MQITGAFLNLSLICLILNIYTGIALTMANWDNAYEILGIFSLPCWAIVLLMQVRMFVRHIKQFNDNQKMGDANGKKTILS